jgi:ribosome modulation factor
MAQSKPEAEEPTSPPVDPKTTIPSFLQRVPDVKQATDEPPPAPADEPQVIEAEYEEVQTDIEDFEDPAPPHRANDEAKREAEKELERKASGHTADDLLGANGKPLLVGDIAVVKFGAGKSEYEKNGTLVDIIGQNVVVRLIGAKDPLGETFPAARVSTVPINGGKPVKTKAEQKKAAEHANRLSEYREAKAKGKARPSDGFAHAHAAADEETAPLPKRVLKGHNGTVSNSTIYRYIGARRDLMEKIASLTGKLRDLDKKAKDDGVEVGPLKKIMSELKLSPEEIVAEHNTLQHYRAAVNLPSAPIIEEDEEDRESIDKRRAYASNLGYMAGYRGTDLGQNPYPDVSDPCHASWSNAWREAQNNLASKFRILEK